MTNDYNSPPLYPKGAAQDKGEAISYRFRFFPPWLTSGGLRERRTQRVCWSPDEDAIFLPAR
jgi:hypothetical protein